MKIRSHFANGLLLSCSCVALCACAVGPDYHRPSAVVSAHFKQLDGWKEASPGDDVIRGAWWEAYADPELSALLVQVRISNQNVVAYLAAYQKAQALVSATNASFLPTVTATVGKTRSGGSSTSSTTSNSAKLGASWEPDIWGKLRRTAEENTASAEASAAQLAAATLSAQSSLAQDYFQLRVLDEEISLYQQTVEAYTRYQQIVQKQYELGSASRATLSSAQTQLESARASGLDLQWQRAQMEHAIAVLIGKPPAEFSISARPLSYTVPDIPVGVPSRLMERRPDVAYAERNMAAANAAIGVATAAYFPDLTLTGSGGYTSSAWRNLTSLPNRVWSLGTEVSGTVLDFGATRANVRQAEASYDGQVATYRQSVLTALQEVEDYLVELHTLNQEVTVQRRAVSAAKASERQSLNQYLSGMVSYLDVATAQAASLTQQRTLLTLTSDQLVSSVKLIAALGGGWDSQKMTATE